MRSDRVNNVNDHLTVNNDAFSAEDEQDILRPMRLIAMSNFLSIIFKADILLAPPDLPVCSVMQEQTGSSRLLPGRLDAGYMLLESGRLQIVRLANIEGLYDDLTKFLIAGDFELSDRTNLKEHLLNGKTLLLDLSKSDSLRKLSDCYQD